MRVTPPCALATLITINLALAGAPRAYADLAPLAKVATSCEAARATCVDLAVHVAVVDGAPVASVEWWREQLATADRHYAKLGVGFRVVSVTALPAANARVADVPARNALARHVREGAIHVFVTARLDDIDIAGAQLNGVAWRIAPRSPTKLVVLSTIAWPLTLAHELGHVFGLPHSSYPISIMNKTERSEPPHEQRTFADEEYAILKNKIPCVVSPRRCSPRKE